MTKYPKKTNCPACGVRIRLKFPQQSHYHECTCGEWFFYEPIKEIANPDASRPKSTPKIIAPRVTLLAGQPPINTTAPKVTIFRDHEPPVQPKTSLNLSEPETENGETSILPSEETITLTAPTPTPTPKSSKSSSIAPLLIVSGLFILAMLALTAAWLFIDVTKLETEEKKRSYAQEQLKEKNFLLASVKFEELASLYPLSAWHQEYLFLNKIASQRNGLDSESHNSVESFVTLRATPLTTSDHSPFAWLQYLGLIQTLLEKSVSDSPLLTWAEAEADKVKKKIPRDEGETETLLALIVEKRNALAIQKLEEQEKASFLAQLKKLEALPTHETFQSILYFMEQELFKHPKSKNLSDAKIALDNAKTRHLNSIVYEKNNLQEKQSAPSEKSPKGWKYFQHPEQFLQNPNWLPELQTPVLTVNHGILYALDRTRGNVLWVKRLGIDVESLPLVFSANQATEPTLITLEDNGISISALDKAGETLWKTSLGGTCLAGITLWHNTALIPCLEGFLIEIELAGGNILGRWNLGQSLLNAPCVSPDLNSCFIPADPGYILCLDLATKKCTGIIASNHALGTLIPPLITVFLKNQKEPSHILLTNEEPGPITSIKVFPLPTTQDNYIKDPVYSLNIPGGPIFAPVPYQNRLAILDETQHLSFFAWNQDATKTSLIPFFDEKNQNKPLANMFESLKQKKGTSQVLAFDGSEAEILYNGNFCKLFFAWNLRDGLKLASSKSPFHQTGTLTSKPALVEDPALSRNAWAITGKVANGSTITQLIDSEKNKVLWKTLISPRFETEPLSLALTPEKNFLLLADSAGNLFLAKNNPQPSITAQPNWNEGAFCIATTPSADSKPLSHLLQLEDKKSALQLLQDTLSKKVTLKLITFDNESQNIKTFNIPQIIHSFAGSPKTLGNQILIPLSNGSIARIWFKENKPLFSTGPTWKSLDAPNNTSCKLAILHNNTFCFSDGTNETSFFHWNNLPDATFEKIKTTTDITLPNCFELKTFVSEKGTLGTFLSTSGTFLSFKFTPDGAFSKTASFETSENPKALWSCKNENQQYRSALISNSNLFTWIDPLQGKSLWSTQLDAAPLVEPFVIEGKIFLFLTSGRSLLLDESKGTILEFELNLPPELFPSSCPFPALNQGAKKKFFIPFSDGTMLETSIEELIKPSGIVR